MLQIGINARTLATQSIRGWSRYTANLIRELSHTEIMLYLFSDRTINESLLEGSNKKNIQIIIEKKKPYLLWEQMTLPKLCKEYQVDLLHCPIHFGLPFRGVCPQVVTLHDAIEIAFYDKKMSITEKMDLELYLRF